MCRAARYSRAKAPSDAPPCPAAIFPWCDRRSGRTGRKAGLPGGLSLSRVARMRGVAPQTEMMAALRPISTEVERSLKGRCSRIQWQDERHVAIGIRTATDQLDGGDQPHHAPECGRPARSCAHSALPAERPCASAAPVPSRRFPGPAPARQSAPPPHERDTPIQQ